MGNRQVQASVRTYRTILVDDDALFRDWLRPLLEESAHFQLSGEAANGEECIALIDKEKPDLVILDVYMPDWDGLALAEHIKTHFPSVKTIVTSSHSDCLYSRLAERDGALAFIPKARLSITALLQALQ